MGWNFLANDSLSKDQQFRAYHGPVERTTCAPESRLG